MSTRHFLPKALRQCRSSLAQSRQQPQQHISTTPSKEAGLRQVRSAPNASSQLKDLGAGDNTAAPPNQVLRQMLADSNQRRSTGAGANKAANAVADLEAQATTDNYLKMMPRFWTEGSIYAPRDLGVGEATKWSTSWKASKADQDKIAVLGINPLDNYRNFTFISEHMTSYGRILHSNKTGLSPVNQRKMAKTIRRAIGLGIHPSVHFHPELLKIRSRGKGLPLVVVPKDKRNAAPAATSTSFLG
ncbi:hypothetical protein V8F33_001786 [Rhypophila sp. PSN 637]